MRLCPLASTNDVLSIFTTLLPLLWSLLVRSAGSRIPLPDKKAELLNTNALKHLLPGSPDRSTGVGSSGGGAENAETAELLARLRKSSGERMQDLDRKAVGLTPAERRRRLRASADGNGGGGATGSGAGGSLSSTGGRRRRDLPDPVYEFAASDGALGKRPRSDMGSRRSGARSRGTADAAGRSTREASSRHQQSRRSPTRAGRPGVLELASKPLLEAVGMTLHEFKAIDEAYRQVERRFHSEALRLSRAATSHEHEVRAMTKSHTSATGTVAGGAATTSESPLMADVTDRRAGNSNVDDAENVLGQNAALGTDPLATKLRAALSGLRDSPPLTPSSEGAADNAANNDWRRGTVRAESVATALSSAGLELDGEALSRALRASAAVATPSAHHLSGTGNLSLSADPSLRSTWGDGDDGTESNNLKEAIQIKPSHSSSSQGDGMRVRPLEVAARVKARVRLEAVARHLGLDHSQVADEPDDDDDDGMSSNAAHSVDHHHRSQDAHSRKRTGGKHAGSSRRHRGAKSQANGGHAGGAGHQPPALLNLDGSVVSSSASSANGMPLPPLRPGARAVARAHLTAQQAGGPTPRALKPGNHADLNELRSTLAATDAGLAELRSLVKKDVQWVQLNCTSTNMSVRAQFFCKQWGAEKISALLASGELSRQRKALLHWRAAAALQFNLQRLELYLKFTACRKVVLSLGAGIDRCRGSALKHWQLVARLERREEADGAACEVQRHARAFMGKVRFKAFKRFAYARRIQCLVRIRQARARCRLQRRVLKQSRAAACIQRAWRRVVAVRQGRKEAQNRRRHRAAKKIQRCKRSLKVLRAARAYAQEMRVLRASTTLQCSQRSKVARVEANKRRSKKRRAEGALKIQCCWRQRKARFVVKLKRKQRAAVIVLQCWSRCTVAVARTQRLRDQHAEFEAARTVQRLERGKSSRQRVAILRKEKKDKEEKEAAMVLQQQTRSREAKKELQRRKEAKAAKDKEEGAAATKLQALQRGKMGRQSADQAAAAEKRKQERLRLEALRRERAAVVLQAAQRGKVGRIKAAARRRVVEAEQEARRQLENAKAVRIQAWCRRKLAVRIVRRRRAARVEGDARAGELLEEKAVIVQAAFRASRCRYAYKEKLKMKRNAEYAAEMERQAADRARAAAEAAARAAERKRIEEEQRVAATAIQSKARQIQAKALVETMRKAKAARELAELERQASTLMQKKQRGLLAKKKVTEERGDQGYSKLTGVKPTAEVRALQGTLRETMFKGGQKGCVRGLQGMAAAEVRLAEANEHFAAIGELAANRLKIAALGRARVLWANAKVENKKRRKACQDEIKAAKSELLQEQQRSGLRGTKTGDVQMAELEESFAHSLEADARAAQATSSEAKQAADAAVSEGFAKAEEAFKSAQSGKEPRALAAEIAVLAAQLVPLKGGRAPAKVMNAFCFTPDEDKAAAAATCLSKLKQSKQDLKRRTLDAEMAERAQDGVSDAAALRVQGMVRCRIARRVVDEKRAEHQAELDNVTDEGDGGRRGRSRGKSRGSGKGGGSGSDSDSDPDEARYKRKARLRKKRQEKRDEKMKKRKEREAALAAEEEEAMNRNRQGGGGGGGNVGSSSSLKPPKKFAWEEEIDGEDPDADDTCGLAVLPGDVIDNPELFGDANDANRAMEAVYVRMFRREGQMPLTRGEALRARQAAASKRREAAAMAEIAAKFGLTSPGGGGMGGTVGSGDDEAAAEKREGGDAFDTSTSVLSTMSQAEQRKLKKKAGLLGLQRSKLGGAGDSSSDDADSSSGDDDNAFATRAFAAMGSTGKIVPLNRELIQAEATSALDTKLNSVLDAKLAAFEASKQELYALQASLADKIKLLEERGAGGGGGGGNNNQLQAYDGGLARPSSSGSSQFQGGGAHFGQELALAAAPEHSAVDHGHLPEGWSEVYDETTATTYYFNEATGETSWTLPGQHGFDDHGASYESDEGYETTGSKGTAVDYDTDAQWDGGYDHSGAEWDDSHHHGSEYHDEGGYWDEHHQWVSDWEEQWDDQAQARYWFNNTTQEASWTEPEGWAASQAHAQANDEWGDGYVAATGAGAGEWVSYLNDETGDEYWVNDTTGETSYEDPNATW